MKKTFPKLLLLGILLFIFWTNFDSQAWLIGWDNLLPELNPTMNLRRSLAAVWQEYQGLGLVGGMGHATDLVRQLLLFPLTFILPANWIRYFWHLAMLALGTFGLYWGLGNFKKLTQKERLLGALFYLLNFGTVQYFWAPFDAFSTFWGFFPWLIFSFWQVLEKPTRSRWLALILLNFLAIPGYYTQTLFFAYLLCLAALVLVSLDKIKRSLIALCLIFLVNAFWLLPFFYFLATNVHHPRLGMINQMASTESLQRNQARGTLSDWLLLRGYYYDFPDMGKTLMAPWHEHFSQPWTLEIGLILGGLAVLGMGVFLNRQKAPQRRSGPLNRLKWAILGIGGLGALGLLSATPPLSWLNSLLRQSAFLDQAFRAPFTKLVVPAAFASAIFLPFGVQALGRWLAKVNKKASIFLCLMAFLGLAIFSWPVFRGNLFSPQMRLQIPGEYFQLIEFFKNQPKTARIANLPQGNFWGWTLYRWGLRGSGFLWHGIEQPILDRAWDVWNLNNEQYYWELNYALQKQDLGLLESVFEKYFIEFVLFDDHVFFPSEKEYGKLALKTKALLGESSRLARVANFGPIEVYQFDRQTKPQLIDGQITTSPATDFTQKDVLYQRQGVYLAKEASPDIFYPFAELFTNRFQTERDFQVEENDQFWLISRSLPDFKDGNYQLETEPLLNKIVLPLKDGLEEKAPFKTEEILLKPDEFINPHHCAAETEGSAVEFRIEGDQLVFNARKAALCVDWENYDFFRRLRQPVKIEVEFEYQSNNDEWPQYCFWDTKAKDCVNNKDWPPQGFSPSWQKFKETIWLDPRESDVNNLAFILDAYHQETAKEIRYRQIKLKIEYFSRFSLGVKREIEPEAIIEDDQLIIKLPKVDSPWLTDNPVAANLFQLEPQKCNQSLEGESYQREIHQEQERQFIRLRAKNSDSCLSWHFPELPLGYGWLVEVETRHQKGRPWFISSFGGINQYKFFVTELAEKRNWEKNYFVIPAYSTSEKGITLSLGNTSFNHSEAVNDVAGVRLIPLPWEWLKSLRFIQKQELPPPQAYVLTAESNIWRYSIELPAQVEADEFYLILPQSFDAGWQLLGVKNAEHVLVNNWANGWKIKRMNLPSEATKIQIIFWPQILQYIGFGLLLPAFASLIFLGKKK